MNIETPPCSDFAGETLAGDEVEVTDVWEESEASMFICSVPSTNVGLCDGDSGGKF